MRKLIPGQEVYVQTYEQTFHVTDCCHGHLVGLVNEAGCALLAKRTAAGYKVAGTALRVLPKSLVLTVDLLSGPDKPQRRWEFVVRRPSGYVDSRFSWEADVELNSEAIVEAAWEHAAYPDRIADVQLSPELEKLFGGCNVSRS